ncbi:MAG: oligosaccharide flippase family protein [Thermoplasmata archaeon]|jgi:O-antigen/teichoic acid export membrane protein
MATRQTDLHRSAIDSLGRGTSIMVVGTILLLFLSLIGRVAVARNLTLVGFGDFNLGLSFAGLLSLVALLGLHQAVARSLAERADPAARRYLIRWTAGVTVVAAVVTSSLVYFFASQIASLFDPSQHAELTVVFQMFSVTIGLTLLCTFIASIFQGFEDTVPNAWINQAVQPGAFLVFVYIFFYFHLELTAALLAWVISNVVTFVALLLYAWRRLPRHLPPVSSASSMLPTGLWTLALALWGVTTLTYVTGYADTLILGAFRPEQQVGIYSAVLTIGRLILIASGAVAFIFLPVAARLIGEGNIAAIRSTFTTTARWTLLFTVPLFLVFAFLPGDSLYAVFGGAYVPGSQALVVISLCALVSVAFGPVNAALAGMAMTRPLLIATAASAISNIILSFTLIPAFGLMGAAVAWSVARVIYPAAGATSLYFTHRITPLRRTLLLPLAGSLALGIPVFVVIGLIPHPSWIVFPLYFVGLGIFVGCMLATHSIEEGDFVACRLAERLFRRPLPRLQGFLERFSAAPVPSPELP